MRRVSERDPAALEVIYDRYGHVVYSTFQRITGNRSAAEDLVQELFLRIWNRACEFDAGKGSVTVWILSVTRNMAIDYLRSAQAHFQLRLKPVDALEFARKQPSSANYESVLANSSFLGHGLHSLDGRQRQVLQLAYFEGFSQSEIAAQMNVPLGTVKSWMRAGIRCLRTVMESDARDVRTRRAVLPLAS